MTVTASPAGMTAWDHASLVRSEQGTRTMLTVVGDLDYACAGRFATAVATVAADGTDVVLDMAGVAFMDSAGLDAIDRVRRFFEILGLALVVLSPPLPIHRSLGLGHLDGLIEQAEATG